VTRLASLTFVAGVFICTLPSGKSLCRRDDWLVLRGASIAAGYSKVHRAGFRVLCRAHGWLDHRSSGVCSPGSGAGTSGLRVSRGPADGSARTALLNYLRFFGIRALGGDDCPLQVTARKKAANKAPEPTPTSVTLRARARVAPAPVLAHLGYNLLYGFALPASTTPDTLENSPAKRWIRHCRWIGRLREAQISATDAGRARNRHDLEYEI
jgi:hypothetical protein